MVRARGLPGIALAAFALTLAAAPAAHASQTIVGFSSDTFTVRSPESPGSNQNLIAVSEDASHQLHVVDGGTNVTVVAQSPCFQISVSEAGCPEAANHTATLSVTPGAGDDSVQINLPDKPLSGVAHVEVFGGGGDDHLFGGGGDDTLEGDGRRDGSGVLLPASTLVIGRDILVGNGGRDTLRGGPLTDYLNGAGLTTTDTAANTLDGGEGADFLDAGNSLGPDHFVGGTGQDEFSAQPHPLFDPANPTHPFPGPTLPNDVQPDIRGGDTVSYATRTFTGPGTTGVTADLDGTADDGGTGEGDQIDADVESLVGTIRDDNLTGSSSQNLLEGGPGSDILSGAAGGDLLRFKDGVADHCFLPGAGDVVDADLVDPTPDSCKPHLLLPLSFIFNFQPVDETIPYVGIGPKLRRSGAARLVARVKCARGAKRTCTGTLSVSAARSRHALAKRKYRAAPGQSARVTLNPGKGNVRALHAAGFARLTSVSRGTSHKGPTTTFVVRRV
jgi:hypothetical protein